MVIHASIFNQLIDQCRSSNNRTGITFIPISLDQIWSNWVDRQMGRKKKEDQSWWQHRDALVHEFDCTLIRLWNIINRLQLILWTIVQIHFSLSYWLNESLTIAWLKINPSKIDPNFLQCSVQKVQDLDLVSGSQDWPSRITSLCRMKSYIHFYRVLSCLLKFNFNSLLGVSVNY